MQLTRRSALSVVSAAGLGALLARPLPARAETDPRETERSFGKPDAKVTVTEFFSLTCTHCAHFANAVMPQVIKEMVEPGKVRFVYRDFPLDQVALTAAMVARALPPERYEPFIAALFANQDRWAFARGADTVGELGKLAGLAGMSQDTFNATIKDTAFRNWILTQQAADQKKYGIDSTPTFLIAGKTHPGAMEFDAFAKLVEAAS
ncbi:MAG: DsbA family protein [Proteobacteria bacterium]|nr:DsbA family protein [Pseudomonadota bacterium]